MTPRTGQLRDRVNIVAYRAIKATAQLRYPRDNTDRRHVFIVGMQRSGTTTVVRVFERDLRTRVFQEHSPLSNQDLERKIRLNPLRDVERTLQNVRAPLVVLKPLVETQKTPMLLDHFDPSLAIWCYRHYLAVAQSNIRQFADRGGKNNLRPIVQRDRNNWRAEVVPPDVEDTVDRLFSEDMTQLDAAALFWWVRNRLFFDLALDTDARVHMLQFDRFVTDPRGAMTEIYDRLDVPYPRRDVTAGVDARVARPNPDAPMNNEIRELCDLLWEQLRAADPGD